MKMKFHLTVRFALLVCCYFANDGDGSSEKLKVAISFESLDCASLNLFKHYLTRQVFQELSTCPIEWNLLPCASSFIKNKVLTCGDSDEECYMNRIYACATNIYQNDQTKLGNFIICTMASDCQKNNSKKCAEEIKLDWNEIEKCSGETKADEFCDRYNYISNIDLKITDVPGMVFGSKKYNSDFSMEAFLHFKKVVCEQLQDMGLECQAC